MNKAVHFKVLKSFYSSNIKPKTGILMMNMGGPEKSANVEDFLKNLFSDKDIFAMPFQKLMGSWISKRRAPRIAKQYDEIGGGSPITKWTKLQGEGMVRILDQISPETAPHKYYIGFRYVPPFSMDSIQQMHNDGIERAVAFSQYPQFSCTTAGSSINELTENIIETSSPMAWSVIDRWPRQPQMIEAFAQHIEQEIETRVPPELRDTTVIMFSAHSIPVWVVDRGDPYPQEVGATVHAVMERLRFKYPYRLVWQSKVGPLKWLGPSTESAMIGFKKNHVKSMVLVPIAFTSDHIETLYEMDIEYCTELAAKHGISHVYRAASLNDNPVFIQGLAELVGEHLRSGKARSVQYRLRCPGCINERCIESRGLFRTQQPAVTNWTDEVYSGRDKLHRSHKQMENEDHHQLKSEEGKRKAVQFRK